MTVAETKEIKPRGEGLFKNSLTLTHIYQYYIKDLEEDSKYNIDYKIYRAICVDANKLMMSKIIDEGYFFKMPYRLGTLRIKKRKVDFNNLKPDFGLYNKSNGKYKNKILNDHSGNYYVRFYWNKYRETIVKNKTPYSFIPTRANKRYLAKVIKDNGILQINKYFD